MINIVKNNINILKKIYKFNKSYVIASLFFSMIGSFSPLLSALLLKNALNFFSSTISYKLFLTMLTIYTIYTILIFIASAYLNNLFYPKSVQKIYTAVNYEIYKKVAECRIDLYNNTDFLNEYNRAISNIQHYTYGVINSFSKLLSGGTTIISMATLLALIDPILIPIALALALLNFTFNKKFTEIDYNAGKEKASSYRKQNYISRLFYLKSYAKEMRKINLKNKLLDIYDDTNHELLNNIEVYGKRKNIISIIKGSFQLIANLLTLLYLFFEMINNVISSGDFAVGYSSNNQLSAAITSLMETGIDFYKNSLYIDEINSFMNKISFSEQEPLKTEYFESLHLIDVSYKYSNTDKYVIKNVNLTINKGEKIALVGFNGSGKSTLINILAGLYNPTSGQVLLNNVPIEKYSKQSLNKIIGILFQDFNVYNISILENILLGQHSSSVEENADQQTIIEIKALMEKFNFGTSDYIDEIIYRKYGNEVHSDGIELSGGQKQKIALLRTLYSKCPLILLDEPLSSQDTFSQSKYIDKIIETMPDSTLLFITHHLSDISKMDKVYSIENGEVMPK
ncbi:MAG: ABC transporter ATP-binding protein [Oscillospiraceae bacterium]|nr:ABC transporter ATP-binding protein [Oscillospiraceae bacterium]